MRDDLASVGYDVTDGAIGRWVRGETDPGLDVALYASRRWRVSLDLYAQGQPEDQRLRDQVTELAGRFDRLAANLHGFEAEIARHQGLPRPELEHVGELLGLTVAQLRKEIPAAVVVPDREALPHSQEA